MDTEAVRSFVRAAELGQLQRAADELGVTQQAVSKRIASLERGLDVQLFTRTARGVVLTLDALADSADVATLVGSRDRYVWPTNHDLRRIPIVNPTIVYPLSLILPRTTPHPGLQAIIEPPGDPAGRGHHPPAAPGESGHRRLYLTGVSRPPYATRGRHLRPRGTGRG